MHAHAHKRTLAGMYGGTAFWAHTHTRTHASPHKRARLHICELMFVQTGGVHELAHSVLASQAPCLYMDRAVSCACTHTHTDTQHRRTCTHSCTGTIEERILKLQDKKQLVFEGTVGRDAEALTRLTEDDLRFLFS